MRVPCAVWRTQPRLRYVSQIRRSACCFRANWGILNSFSVPFCSCAFISFHRRRLCRCTAVITRYVESKKYFCVLNFHFWRKYQGAWVVDGERRTAKGFGGEPLFGIHERAYGST